MPPDFIIVGAPKAGTTALHDALANHPQLCLSPVKEPKFFLCDGRPPDPAGQRGPGDAHSAQEWVWHPEEYRQLFAAAPPGTLTGESTPLYLRDRGAHRRIRELIPQVKLIAVLRDPVDRAYSNWTHLWCDGLEPEPDFLAACRLESERIAQGWAPFWRYLELGRYGEQLEHLYQLFPTEQVQLLRYRHLVESPSRSLDRICSFLGVQTGLLHQVPSSNVSTWVAHAPYNSMLRGLVRAGAAVGAHVRPEVWCSVSRPLLRLLRRRHANRPHLSREARRELVSYFAEDVATLERLTGESYADWLRETGRGTYSVRKS
jgi:sulfotransferase family protein